MTIPTYTSTPGLDRYPECERFAVYRATHRRLMHEDADYRQQWRSHVIGIVCVALVPIGSFASDGFASLLLSMVSIMAGIAGVACLSFRQQRLMNEKIGKVLLHQPT